MEEGKRPQEVSSDFQCTVSYHNTLATVFIRALLQLLIAPLPPALPLSPILLPVPPTTGLRHHPALALLAHRPASAPPPVHP